jgi:hypothetical protein
MDLYLVITDGDYNWIGVVEKKPDNYWVDYEIGLGYNPNGVLSWNERTLYRYDGCLHRGPSYLYDMDVFDWRMDYPKTSLNSDFSIWYRVINRDKVLNELLDVV